MSHIFDVLKDITRRKEHISLKNLPRQETATLRALHILSRAPETFRHNLAYLYLFSVQHNVWCHQHSHGWGEGVVASMNVRTINAECTRKIYAAHSNRVHS